MVIRSYLADSVASALKQVRTDMGGDAVVLKTRVVKDDGSGKQFEVTACLDQPTVQQADTILRQSKEAAPNVVEAVGTSRFDPPETVIPVAVSESGLEDRLVAIEAKLELLLQAGQLERLGLQKDMELITRAVRAMQVADVPDHYIADFFEAIRNSRSLADLDSAGIHQKLVEQLEEGLEPGIDFKVGDRVLVVGSAGSGKTSLIGRLAAQLTYEQNLPVKLVSLDNYKVGAMDEIASYAVLLGIGEIDTMNQSLAAPESKDDDKVVLIDTGAFPQDQDRLAELKDMIRELRPTHRLAVFSALTRSSDIETQVRQMAWLEPTHLVFTMTDLTDRQGSLLAGICATDVNIAMITDSPSGADSFRTPDAKTIAYAILGQEVTHE